MVGDWSTKKHWIGEQSKCGSEKKWGEPGKVSSLYAVFSPLLCAP